MPFKSKAQRRKFAELLMKGELSPETFEERGRREIQDQIEALLQTLKQA
jgi:hypothetical protein